MGHAHCAAVARRGTVLREALKRAASERRGEVKPKAELVAATVKPAERRLLRAGRSRRFPRQAGARAARRLAPRRPRDRKNLRSVARRCRSGARPIPPSLPNRFLKKIAACCSKSPSSPPWILPGRKRKVVSPSFAAVISRRSFSRPAAHRSQSSRRGDAHPPRPQIRVSGACFRIRSHSALASSLFVVFPFRS